MRRSRLAFVASSPVNRVIPAPSLTDESRLCPPTCSLRSLPRRAVLHFLPAALVIPVLPSPSFSESLNERGVRRDVNNIVQGLSRAKELAATVKAWSATLSDDDTLYVLRYIPIWLEPARVAMQSVATQKGVDVGDPQVAATKAAATLGHLLELKMEAKGKSKDGVLRELDEFVETADEFLALPALVRFTGTT